MLRSLKHRVIFGTLWTGAWGGLLLAQGGAGAPASRLWPEQWGELKLERVEPVRLAAPEIWREMGLEAAEAAWYAGASGQAMRAQAYRLADSTAALAAFLWQRPQEAKPSTYKGISVETQDAVLIAFGNYLLRFDGRKPTPEEFGEYLVFIPHLTRAALPSLHEQMPSEYKTPNSERFILGPETLQEFFPGIEPSMAAFHLGTEAETAVYRVDGRDLRLAVFSFPTPNAARERSEEFARIQGAMVKRSGPWVAVLLSPPDRNAAEKLLSMFRYRANITWNEPVGGNPKNSLVDLLLAIFTLTGILLLFCLAGGVVAFFLVRRRRGMSGDPKKDPMVILHLTGER